MQYYPIRPFFEAAAWCSPERLQESNPNGNVSVTSFSNQLVMGGSNEGLIDYTAR